MKRLAAVTGEASGDLIAAQALSPLMGPELIIEGIGGRSLQAMGMNCWYAADRLAVRGYVEALSRLPDILAVRRGLLKRLWREPPDLFLGVDAPDFNLGVEKRLRARGVPTVHFVSPSIWAWRPERIQKIEKAVDHMLCLFPFEPELYRQSCVHAVFVGHPLADMVPVQPNKEAALWALREAGLAGDRQRPVLALLPGSRTSEIAAVGPAFLDAAIRLASAFQAVIPAVNPSIEKQIKSLAMWAPAEQAGVQILSIPIVPGQPTSHTVLEASAMALVASGTATLEAAMYKLPMVIGYRIPPLSYWWMKRKARVSRIGLPNLLAGEDLVPELIQSECTGQNLAQAILMLSDQPAVCAHLMSRFSELHQSLRQGCALRVSGFIQNLLWP